MLKRKLLRAILIATAFVFQAAWAAPVTVNASDSTNNEVKPTGPIAFNGHAFDSTGLCVCLAEIENEEIGIAPRIHLNKQASIFVKDHLKKNCKGLEKIRAKTMVVFPVIDSVFSYYSLPVELKYLAVIESQLNNQARSRVGAKGMWQFMPSTARLYGLKVSGKHDERTYSYKSTVAAAKYLSYLHGLFDDWLLVIAAYNSGPGYVYAAIKKSGSRNFWALQNFLPAETRKHVKKFIGTHYFFEGHGSMATLTKAETVAHIAAVNSYMDKIQKAEENADIAINNEIPDTLDK